MLACQRDAPGRDYPDAVPQGAYRTGDTRAQGVRAVRAGGAGTPGDGLGGGECVLHRVYAGGDAVAYARWPRARWAKDGLEGLHLATQIFRGNHPAGRQLGCPCPGRVAERAAFAVRGGRPRRWCPGQGHRPGKRGRQAAQHLLRPVSRWVPITRQRQRLGPGEPRAFRSDHGNFGDEILERLYLGR